MKTFQTTRRVAHSAENMFALVADVKRYPEFLPLCRALKIRSRETIGGKEVIAADMTVAYMFIRETFTSRVSLDREALAILVEYLNGPFKHLENKWNFIAAGDGACDVKFHLAYEMLSPALELTMGAVFQRAFGKFAAAFEARADTIYGAGARSAPRATAV